MSDDAPKSNPLTRAPASSSAHRSAANGAVGAGEGVDRKIEKKMFTPKRLALGAAALLALGFLVYGVWSAAAGGQSLNVEREKLTISTAERGPFQEYIAVTGTAVPKRTVYLDAVEGGRVEDVYAREGQMVEQGDPLLKLSNSDLQLRLMSSEAQLSEQVSRLQTMRFQIEQNRLNLQQQLAQMDYEIQRLSREHARNAALFEKELIAQSEYEQTKDELAYQRRRKQLTRQAYQQDSLAQAQRLGQMQASVDRMRRSFDTLQDNLDQLTVRAPVAGRLTALDAEVGTIRPSGDRFGQIDVLGSGYKVRAQIDEFYIERVRTGQTATTQRLGGKEHRLTVQRVYPEVTDGRFEVDLAFEDEAPEGLRRGQTIRLRLQLGSPEEALLLARGGFYQSTGGNWAYVLSGDGEAVRRSLELGRQNPEHFEVLSGLEAGDRVVTSSYETFGEADRLVFD